MILIKIILILSVDAILGILIWGKLMYGALTRNALNLSRVVQEWQLKADWDCGQPRQFRVCAQQLNLADGVCWGFAESKRTAFPCSG